MRWPEIGYAALIAYALLNVGVWIYWWCKNARTLDIRNPRLTYMGSLLGLALLGLSVGGILASLWVGVAYAGIHLLALVLPLVYLVPSLRRKLWVLWGRGESGRRDKTLLADLGVHHQRGPGREDLWSRFHMFTPLVWILGSFPFYFFPLEFVVRRFHRALVVRGCRAPRAGLCRRLSVFGPYHPFDNDIVILLRLIFAFLLLGWMDVLVPRERMIAACVFAFVLLYEMLSHTFKAFLDKPSKSPRALLLALLCYVTAIALFAAAYRALSIDCVERFTIKGKVGELCPWQAWRLSAATMTTLGYGAILPESAGASTIATIESIIGVVFIAVFIGSIVSMISASGNSRAR